MSQADERTRRLVLTSSMLRPRRRRSVTANSPVVENSLMVRYLAAATASTPRSRAVETLALSRPAGSALCVSRIPNRRALSFIARSIAARPPGSVFFFLLLLLLFCCVLFLVVVVFFFF